VARKAENTGSRLLGLLLICLVGCWLYYHGRSLTWSLFAFLYGIGLKSREGKVCTVGSKIVMAATQASMDILVGLGGRVCGQTKQTGSKEGSEWMNLFMVLCCGRRDIN